MAIFLIVFLMKRLRVVLLSFYVYEDVYVYIYIYHSVPISHGVHEVNDVRDCVFPFQCNFYRFKLHD